MSSIDVPRDTVLAPADGTWHPFTATLVFDWERPPLSMNDRYAHPSIRHKLTASTRAEACAEALRQRLPELTRCRVTMTWVVTDRRKRDVENPVATLKAVCDGLVDAGIVPDDEPRYMEKLMPIIEWRDKKLGHTPHIEITIERLPS